MNSGIHAVLAFRRPKMDQHLKAIEWRGIMHFSNAAHQNDTAEHADLSL